MEDIALSILYGVSESAKQSGEYKLLRITDIQDNKVDWCSVPYTDYNQISAQKYILKAGDILFARTGATVGKSYLVEEIDCQSIYASYLIRIKISKEINPKYVKKFFESSYYWNQIFGSSVGIGQPNVNGTSLANLMIPIPPWDEQNRIMKEVEKWICSIDKLDACISDINKSIIAAKSKILDLAISGKLVPQDPADEPAIDLLKRINPDFKPCDNPHYPFEVPSSWVFASGKDIFQSMKSVKPTGEEFCYIDIDSVDNKSNIITSPKIVKTENAPSRASRYTKSGDVIFSMVRPYLRNIAIVQYDNCIASTGFYVCSPTQSLCSDYLFLMMLSDYVVDGLNQYMKGDNSPSINTNNILSWEYPVPPLNEQKRIVAEAQRLYMYLNEVESCITS